MENSYKIIQTDALSRGWTGILLQRPSEESSKSQEEICRYCSGIFSKTQQNLPSTDLEILGVINSIDKFQLYLNKEFLIRIDCKNIVEHFNKAKNSKAASKRWIAFIDNITGKWFYPKFEHITEKYDYLADIFSKLIAQS